MPEAPPGFDLLLEIEVDGAQQVRAAHPDAVLVFVLPPSRAEQERRLRGRGDPEDKVQQRLKKAHDEEAVGLAIADHAVVNDDLARTTDDILAFITGERSRRAG
jgi:guanylate kinase